MRARTVIMGGLVAPALSGCAWPGNAATTPVTFTHGDSGNLLPFYVQQPSQPKDDCDGVASLLADCDTGGKR